ncbi:MAG: GTP 3',8-cyclase MoaA, partial [Pseudomonadota bacterium]|nr:GTP 3',8-cyclase MoaA [Pseudomonadota bacterium]
MPPANAFQGLRDTLKRPLHDLRISVTDRCNFRCGYCMPRDVFGKGHRFLPRRELLSYEEIETLARVFAGLGVRKLRLTGGEPLIRHDLEILVEKLAAVPGISDLSLTTNASLLSAKRARSLHEAGLMRLNISLDALDDATYKRINDVDFPVSDVLAGIDNARSAGFDLVKVNMVVQKGVNEHAIVPMARHFRGSGVVLRFIEFMDVGNSNQWDLSQVFSAREILDALNAELPLEPLDPNYRGEVARRWRYLDNSGEVGVISSITQPFCRDCARARLSAVGELYTCLFAGSGHDLRRLLREGAGEQELIRAVADIWRQRDDRYSELR